MEKEKIELESLNEVITYLTKAVEYASVCDTVTKEEYRIMADYVDKLEKRKIELQISIDGCIIEEV